MAKQQPKPTPKPVSPPPPPPPIESPIAGIEWTTGSDEEDDEGNAENEKLAAEQPRAPLAPVVVDRTPTKTRVRNIKLAVARLREVVFLPIDQPDNRAANIATIYEALESLKTALALPME